MKNFFKSLKFSFLSILIMFPLFLTADEGMWLPLLLEKNYSAMEKLGFKLTPDQIYNLNKSSLKDAIINFGGFCSG